MFAAAIPQPAHLLSGSMLATGIRDAILASSFKAHMMGTNERKPLAAVTVLKSEASAEKLTKKPARTRQPRGIGSQTDEKARSKFARMASTEQSGRAQREAQALPVMTGEELVLAVLEALEEQVLEAAKEWEVAERLPWLWRDQEGRPVVAWMDVHQHFAEYQQRSHLEAWGRLRTLAGLPAPINPVNEVITVPELVAMAEVVPGNLGRVLRRMMRPKLHSL